MRVKGVGNAEIHPKAKKGEGIIIIEDVNYVPDISANLLSVSKIVKNGYSVLFSDKGVKVNNEQGAVVATGSLVNGLFRLDEMKAGDEQF